MKNLVETIEFKLFFTRQKRLNTAEVEERAWAKVEHIGDIEGGWWW